MNGEEYEIMPHRAIENIKKELDELRKRASSKEAISSESFRKSLDNLTVSINGLMALFKEASEDLKVEEEAEASLKARVGPLMDKIKDIEDENKTIAKAILAVADMINERMPEAKISPKVLPKKPEIEKEIITRTWKESLVPKGEKAKIPPKPMPQLGPIPSVPKPFIERREFTEHKPMAPPGPMPPRPLPEEKPRLTPVPPPKLPKHEEGLEEPGAFPKPMGMPPPGPMPPGPAPEKMPGAMPPGPMPPRPTGLEAPPEKKKGFFGKLFKK
jgi:hypothetical protein